DVYRIQPGDLLVSWSATLDAFIWDREPALLNQHIFKVIPDESVVSKRFLFYLLRLAIAEMIKSEHLHGSTMKHINRGPFLAHRIPIPSLDEQQHIVAEIEKQFTRMDAGVASLKRVQTALKRYRASLLNAACEGHLVGVIGERSRRQLAEVTAKIGSGSTPRGGDAVYRDKGVPFIRSLNVRSTGFRYQGLAYISDGHAKQLDHVVVTPRDVLLNI